MTGGHIASAPLLASGVPGSAAGTLYETPGAAPSATLPAPADNSGPAKSKTDPDDID